MEDNIDYGIVSMHTRIIPIWGFAVLGFTPLVELGSSNPARRVHRFKSGMGQHPTINEASVHAYKITYARVIGGRGDHWFF